MRPNRYIAYFRPASLAMLCIAGAANAQDIQPQFEAAAVAMPVEVPAYVAPEPEQRQTGMGTTIGLETLADMRGGTQIVDNDILVNGRVEDNIADDVLTGSNSVTSGSFANASGISTVIQNTGANVLIQNAMIVNVKFADPAP
ncbi:hypothetical protein [Lysobacter sp.]|uniref:hypothetical protein n=1 Tax=Lysobacter sp. TaxID=72226 RepID=UPI002D3929A3|nr:hypothetical protein [Lysobacter sp.]HZX77017.1 hypothetical protein [Lysobacter sp.]